MTPRRRRMMLVGLIVLGVGAAVAFALTAFQDNLLYFYSPSDVVAGKAPRIACSVSAAWSRRAASSGRRAVSKRASCSPTSRTT